MKPSLRDRNIRLIYATIFLLGIAYGVAIALLALHLDARHFPKKDIGTLAAWFASGIVLFSIPAGGLIRRASPKVVLAVSLLGYAISVTAFPHLTSYRAVAAARFLDGVFSVGIWVSSETVILARAGKEDKAFVTSLYAISMAVGYVLGPLVARGIVAVASMPVAFAVSGFVALVAALLVALRLDGALPGDPHGDDVHIGNAAPDGRSSGAPPSGGLSSLELLRRIKTSCFGTFAYGYFQASVVLFLPLFLVEEKHIAREQTIVIPAFFAAGMLLFSNYAGRLGDRLGHLRVMRVLGAVGLTMVAGFVLLPSFTWMAVAVFIAGASLASISPVSLALQGVIVTRSSDLSRSNGIYNAFYAAGMLLGPPASSALYEAAGGGAMLLHLAGLWAAFVLFTVIFAGDDPAAARLAMAASPAPPPVGSPCGPLGAPSKE